MADAVATLTAGIKTSEFWLNLIPTIVGALMASGLVPQTGPIGTAIGAALVLVAPAHYAWVRSNLKAVAINAGLAALKSVADSATAADAPASK